MVESAEKQGTVIAVSRRFVVILDEAGNVHEGRLSTKAISVTTGDVVVFADKRGETFVLNSKPGSRKLYRSYRGKTHAIGANIDRLFIVTSATELFSTGAIDRLLIAATIEGIEPIIVVNKSDLGVDHVTEYITTYRSLGYKVHEISAKFGKGLEPIHAALDDADVRIVALIGASGVGKSTLLNTLIPTADSRVGEISERTGGGRQTTSQAKAYLYKHTPQHRVLLIDYPGIQVFGLSHLEAQMVADSFPEIVTLRKTCQFTNCAHLKERQCGVQEALRNGEIKKWRYESYLEVLNEVEAAKKY